ncbi:hypothetical protein BC941DRAFT_515959 [Chlamydoabsidia padenii]|nr:hypothetical protein BC941DRAFT_515959 [Chlamydoabsidia padenii]
MRMLLGLIVVAWLKNQYCLLNLPSGASSLHPFYFIFMVMDNKNNTNTKDKKTGSHHGTDALVYRLSLLLPKWNNLIKMDVLLGSDMPSSKKSETCNMMIRQSFYGSISRFDD